jgi:hypothetical protein
MPGSDQSRRPFARISYNVTLEDFHHSFDFGESTSFIAYCTQYDIVREPLASYTHIQNARAEGAIRICKEHVRCLLHSANMTHRFCPDTLCHFCRLYAYWSDANGLSAWEKLDILQPHQMRHNLVKDLHVFGSYVTGHLPREHPHVADTTHNDRPEGVFLGNDLTTPNFWMCSFRAKKVMMLR